MSQYTIINLTTGETIAENVKTASSFFQRAKGLIGRRSLNPKEGLYIPGCRSIHMLFMQFPIDAIFIDQDNTITKIISNLKPFFISFGTLNSKGVIELPGSTLEGTKICIGDRLAFKNNKQ
ncbi:MAG: DUF192 domain-containing protein [Candidatus Magnetomorum sp.]|nr:DUF192 domain-containing protein [Candidatus Magnetomorum sp.]